jgi:PadR family transcriptional regulator PadR
METKEKENHIEAFARQVKTRFIKRFLDLLILSLIEAEPRWGYEIIKESELVHKVKIRHGVLYPMLNKLEAKEFLKSRKELQRGRVRKVYEITETGKQALFLCRNFLKQQASNLSKGRT